MFSQDYSTAVNAPFLYRKASLIAIVLVEEEWLELMEMVDLVVELVFLDQMVDGQGGGEAPTAIRAGQDIKELDLVVNLTVKH